MKVVIDSNVFISTSIAHGGVCHLAVVEALQKHTVYLSEFILTELARNLSTKFKFPEAMVREAVRYYRDESGAILIEPSPVHATAGRDQNDLPILGTALAAEAEVIISGDRDLQTLEQYQGVRICSPRAFLEWTKQSSTVTAHPLARARRGRGRALGRP